MAVPRAFVLLMQKLNFYIYYSITFLSVKNGALRRRGPQFLVFSKTVAIRTLWRIAAYLESDGCCASWISRLYDDRVPFGINSGCTQDSRRVRHTRTPTGGQGHALFFYCPPPFFTAFYCSFLLFTIIQPDMHRIRSGTPIMASPTSRAPPRELSIVAARRGRRGGRFCCPFWQPPCVSC